MKRFSHIAFACVLAMAGSPFQAQDAGLSNLESQVRTLVVVVDQERLFTDSKFGQSVRDQLEQASIELSAENREIEEALLSEEADLTVERPNLDPVVFRQKARAFDEKVTRIRAEQHEKTLAFVQRQETAQAQFYQQALPILTEIVRERGAAIVLEARNTVLAAAQVDITDEAIARIDGTLFTGPVDPQ